jgi:hypothetical protein
VESFKHQAQNLVLHVESAIILDLFWLMGLCFRDFIQSQKEHYTFFFTLPVIVASCESNFSKLKIINKLFSIIYGTRWSNLGILSTESNTTECFNFDDVITNFSAIKKKEAVL